MSKFGTFLPPRTIAQHSEKCRYCDRMIRKTVDEIMKDFETGWWVHTSCLASDLARANPGVVTDRMREIQHFRDGVIDAARCPRCGAGVGARCRELGTERDAVHRVRIDLAVRVSTVVVASA